MANQDARRQDRSAGHGPEAEEPPPFWEWVVAGLGLLLVAGSIAWLTWAALSREPGQVVPVAEVVSVLPQDGHFLVRLRVVNRGRATAEKLRIRAILRREGEVVERGEVELQYLPAQSAREAALFLARDPRQFELELAPESFRVP